MTRTADALTARLLVGALLIGSLIAVSGLAQPSTAHPCDGVECGGCQKKDHIHWIGPVVRCCSGKWTDDKGRCKAQENPAWNLFDQRA